jgi:hypothetical protein
MKHEKDLNLNSPIPVDILAPNFRILHVSYLKRTERQGELVLTQYCTDFKNNIRKNACQNLLKYESARSLTPVCRNAQLSRQDNTS